MLNKIKGVNNERRDFIKAFSAGTTLAAAASLVDIIGAMPAVNTFKKLSEPELIAEEEEEEEEEELDVILKTDGLFGEGLLGEEALTMELSIDGQSIILSDAQLDEIIRQYDHICNP